MKTLYESLLDDFDELDKDVQQNTKISVMKFLIDNYKLNNEPIGSADKKIKISDKPNKDGKYVVDVDGRLEVKNRDIYTLTNNLFVFGKVGGYFSCTDCKNLTSLEGAPKEVNGSFLCSKCENLTSLEGSPKIVRGSFYCGYTNIISLKGGPEKVGVSFDCSNCKDLKTLEGAPKEVSGYFSCSKCENLTSLKGSPKKVDSFHCGYTNITSLKGAPEKVENSFHCANCNKLKNLDYLPKEIRGISYIPDHLQK
jgi:hypothetical protein